MFMVDLHMYSLFKYHMRWLFLTQLRDYHADQPRISYVSS